MKTQNLKKSPVLVFSIYVLAMLLSLLALLFLTGCGEKPQTELTPLTVTALRIGKADAIVALSGTHALVIDAGEEEDGQEVVEFLRKRMVQTVDAMIITHFDRDHVGGADTVLEQMKVGAVYVPDYEGTHPEYAEFLQAAEDAAVPVVRLDSPLALEFGEADVLIEPPDSYEISDESQDFDNNFSLITTIVHRENRMVFMGDAKKQRIREWMEGGSAQPCDFLKVPHHGVYNKALPELFQALQPEYAVICCSDKNPAEPKTLAQLAQFCPHIYETRHGDVRVISDGSSLKVQQ